ncbi:glycosyltransferase [Leptotrichia trevisanii]|uniref:glycosyltransferase n=1 Tax=Leptotrichia trevisanii TaxID=109328 RepID=UPI0026EA49EB|nr:glycosyltransferase [Leptotrichia trevisanii]
MDIKVKDMIKDNSVLIPSKNYAKKKPKLSVLMPISKRVEIKFLKKTINSYIEQTFEDTELIIVDDVNTNSITEQIYEFMKQDKRISYIRHTKQNINILSISLYEALKVARGEYIGFLFDDSVLYPSAYERSLKKMEKEGVKASYGRANYEVKKQGKIYCEEKLLDDLEVSNLIDSGTFIFKKDILNDIGYLDPHICMIDDFFWDFITRIKRKFHIIETGVLFSKRYKFNDKKLLNLIIEEYLKISKREESLFLDKYEDINIFSKGENPSYIFELELKKMYEIFKSKYRITSKYSVENRNFFNDSIVVHCNKFISASSTLIFNKNSNNKNQNLFSYMCMDKDIAKARAVIVVRETNMRSNLLKKLEYAKIPMYLMWDDDFLLLSKEKSFGVNLTENKFKKEAKKFRGLIFTSFNFYKRYKEKKYNENNYLFNPIYLDKIEKKISILENNKLNIAFTGGFWRIKDFQKMLIEVLNNINYEINVMLYLPRVKDLEKIFNKKEINFTVTWYDVTLSYDQLINKLGDKNIHILIHPAQKHSNNENKTKNALITASLLGAALITTDEAPYNSKDSEYDTMSYFLVPNSEKNWTEAIRELLDDELRMKIIDEAREYCKKRYSADCLNKFIENVLQNTPKVDFELYSNRLEKLAYFSGKIEKEEILNQIIDGVGEDIIATKKIEKKLKTFFISDKNEFSSISFIFGTHERKIYGTCEIRVFDDTSEIYLEKINLEELVDNVFYNIYLNSNVENALNKKFYISFIFYYKNNKNKVSIYERNYKYSNNKIIRNIIRPFRKNEIYVKLS